MEIRCFVKISERVAMFEHLVRDGVILFLAGVTILTKVVPTLRINRFTDRALAGTLVFGWVMTLIGFISMCSGVATDSW
jgi:hypothetical protein